MKRILSAFLLACVLVMCTGCVDWERNRKAVCQLVLDNYGLLTEDIQQGDFARSSVLEGIENVYPEGNGFVEYSCGGAGFGPSTAYFGFYYAPDDDMTQIWCAAHPLLPYEDGYLYQQEDGDNRYYTEKIVDHFYYYEAFY